MQLPEQVSALPAQDAVQRFRIIRLNGRHQLEEEVVAVTAQPGARLAQPAVQLGPAGRCQVMDNPIWLHWQVAAPIAMVGYSLLVPQLSFPLPAADLSRAGRQLYRETTTWISQGGASRVTPPPSYVYVTPQRLGVDAQSLYPYLPTERLADGKSVSICPTDVNLEPGVDPFGVAAQSVCTAWSKVNSYGTDTGVNTPYPAGARIPGYDVEWDIPVLIAAVDPVAEAKLDGLNRAVISGHYLTENAGDAGTTSTFPVMASSVSGLDESAVTQVATLNRPASPPSMTASWITQHATAPGQVISTSTTTAHQAYQQLLAALAVKYGR